MIASSTSTLSKINWRPSSSYKYPTEGGDVIGVGNESLGGLCVLISSIEYSIELAGKWF